MTNKINTISENADNNEKYSADLEEALSIVGMGWYNIKYCLVLALFLVAAIVEPIGYGYLLPAAKCDLQMTDYQRGFISSVPYIGIVITSFPWGYLVDTRGRKKMVVYSSFAAGGIGMIAGFMPNFISFTICKALSALCIACPAAVPFSFIGEILPQKYRDLTLSVTSSLQILATSLVPMFAMAVLPLDFRINFGVYDFRPWRLLCMVYASLFVLGAVLISFGPESPKYLMSVGKYDEALKSLQMIYAGNTGKSPNDYPVKLLKMSPESQSLKYSILTSLKVQTLPLLRRPHVKWLALNGFLLFGIFSISNGLYLWIPDVINRVFNGGGNGLTACGVIAQRMNQTTHMETVCNDNIDIRTFTINAVSTATCAILALPISLSVKFIDKKILLILVFFVIGTFCFIINHITEQIVFGALLLSMALVCLAIGPVNAFAVEVFPTHLRGMAVSLAMMMGRSGSAIGANVTGLMINAACDITFYFFGGLMTVCALLGLLIPRSKSNTLKVEDKLSKL